MQKYAEQALESEQEKAKKGKPLIFVANHGKI